ncbi:MAG TPA: UDP-N-acetylmuramate dehydrogenase [Dissulfurispiraceae bacterium]|nr:UDP-N-acetylmuramate dehydrogenase [Dissulfurispiraceae bacterium]
MTPSANILKENYSLRDLTTFGVGGPARYFLEAASEDDLKYAISAARERDVPIFVLGGGSNVLVSDEGFTGLVILNRIMGLRSRKEDENILVYIGAGEDWQQFADYCVAQDWQGVECLAGIPGTVGASPVQNIGAYGQEVSETIAGVRVIEVNTSAAAYLNREACGFDYRKSIFNTSCAGQYVITGVTFKLRPKASPTIEYRELERHFEDRRDVTLKQVRDAVIEIRDAKGLLVRNGYDSLKSAGSFFKNPMVNAERFKEVEAAVDRSGGCSNWAWPTESGDIKISAACLIQLAGFSPGYRKGSVGLSPKHSLILTNHGGAKAEEIVRLAADVQKKVFETFGVVLMPEVKLVGFPPSCLTVTA